MTVTAGLDPNCILKPSSSSGRWYTTCWLRAVPGWPSSTARTSHRHGPWQGRARSGGLCGRNHCQRRAILLASVHRSCAGVGSADAAFSRSRGPAL